MKFLKDNIFEVLFLLGMVLTLIGLYLLSPIAALIIGGVFIMTVAVYLGQYY